MRAIAAGLRIPLAVFELLAFLPMSCTVLMYAASYSMAGNAPPIGLVAGLFLVPGSLVVAPIYALTADAREHPKRALLIMAFPLFAIALAFLAELPSLT